MVRDVCLAGYLVLESSTILDVMGIWKVDWAREVMLEANRLWFYSLAISLVLSVYGLVNVQTGAEAWKLVKLAVMYGADLLLPGSMLGWIKVKPLAVGWAMFLTTILGSEGIWKRVNAVPPVQARVVSVEKAEKKVQ